MFVSLCKVKKDNHLCALLYKEMVEQFNGDVKISLKVCKDGRTRVVLIVICNKYAPDLMFIPLVM